MSLDFYLTTEKEVKKEKTSGIFIRENGQTKEISEKEWYKKFPDREPIKLNMPEIETNEVYSGNITHNVSPMWSLAGIYDDLYNSDGKIAGSILTNLKTGLSKMESNQKEFEKLNPENGWGSYTTALEYLKEIIRACEENPQAMIGISK